VTLQAQKKLDAALVAYDQALLHCPTHLGAHVNRGNVLQDMGRQDDAAAAFRHAICLHPDCAEAHINLGRLLLLAKQPDDAQGHFLQALRIRPTDADAHNNLGNALRALHRPQQALEQYDQALQYEPNHVEAYSNQGSLLKTLGQYERAMDSLNKALSRQPDHPDAQWNKALLLILLGDLKNGWALYDARLHTRELGPHYRNYGRPPWRGEFSLTGKTLLVPGEQGLGDVIQFCRYLPILARQSGQIILEVRTALVALMSRLACNNLTIVATGTPLPPVDAVCPLLSLPYALGTTLDTIPAAIPYLSVDDERRQTWRDTLGPAHRPRIGLAWSGSAGHPNDHARSLPLSALLPLFSLKIEWHSMQTEYRDSDQSVLLSLSTIRQHQHQLHDLTDTAALIDALDLVVCVDTAVAHLAGALGKEVWLMLPAVPDYRWMLDRDDTPWYPGMRLFRQSTPGNWHDVIECVGAALVKRWSC
jgi:Tfp pilus assembly protein PilF